MVVERKEPLKKAPSLQAIDNRFWTIVSPFCNAGNSSMHQLDNQFHYWFFPIVKQDACWRAFLSNLFISNKNTNIIYIYNKLKEQEDVANSYSVDFDSLLLDGVASSEINSREM